MADDTPDDETAPDDGTTRDGSTAPADGAAPATEETAPPLPDDPRVPRIEDADPTRSKELGGAAPAVGPRAEQ